MAKVECTEGYKQLYITRLTLDDLKDMQELPINYGENIYRNLTKSISINGLLIYGVENIQINIDYIRYGDNICCHGTFDIYNKDCQVGRYVFGDGVVIEMDSYMGDIWLEG